jgi:hypothetical protein
MRSLIGQSDRASHQPNELLMRMLVSGCVRTRRHSPIDHRALLAGYHAAANLVGDPLFGH